MTDFSLIAALIDFAEEWGIYTIDDLEEFRAFVDAQLLEGIPDGKGGFIGEQGNE
tara:strand:+ start:260 stop:424 length:165 start_codon:yes stop_codon:yes gene_type:complete